MICFDSFALQFAKSWLFVFHVTINHTSNKEGHTTLEPSEAKQSKTNTTQLAQDQIQKRLGRVVSSMVAWRGIDHVGWTIPHTRAVRIA